MNKGSLNVSGDIHFGKDSVFQNEGKFVHSGTGHKKIVRATYAETATYSGSIVLVATGTVLTGTKITFFAYLNVEKKSRIVIDPAIYSGSVLLSDTGSHIEWFTPSLGDFYTERL